MKRQKHSDMSNGDSRAGAAIPPGPVRAVCGAELLRRLQRLMPLGRRYHPIYSLLNPGRGLVEIPFGRYQLLQPAAWRKQVTDYVLRGPEVAPEFALLASLCREIRGGTIVDLGANVGIYTLLLRSVTDLPIVAYEPQPFLFKVLGWNITYNQLRDVEVRNLACGAARGELLFSVGINGAVLVDQTAEAGPKILAGDVDTQAERVRRGGVVTRVAVTTLDEDLSDTAVGLIKMDVEGFEHKVLQGARGVLERRRPHLFIELHPKQLLEFGSSSEAVIEWLTPRYELEFWNFSPIADRHAAVGAYRGGVRFKTATEFLEATRVPALRAQNFIVGRPKAGAA